MRTHRFALLAAAAAVSVFAPAAAETARDRALPRTPAAKANPPIPSFPGRVRFEPNLGQWDSRIRFLGRAPGCQVMLTDGEAVFRVGGPSGNPHPLHGDRPGEARPAGPGGVVRMEFVGGDAAAALVPSGARTSVSHYFLGNDRARWRSGVPHFDQASYRDLWPGIDLVFRGDPEVLEYDLRVAPGADLSKARLRFTGQRDLSLDGEGNLLLATAGGVLRQAAPHLWQESPEGPRSVAGAFRLLGDGAVGFEAGAYDRARPLVVDPKVEFATYLGGGARDWSADAAVDSTGAIVVVGWTDSTNFPLQGAYQSTFGGGTAPTNDAFVTKYAADGKSLLFSTYYGGNGFDDSYGVVLDPSDNILVCGLTSSSNLPAVSALQAANAGGYDDMYLVKLVSTGSYIIFSTYYGGPGQDEAYDVALDSTGLYLTGATNDANFPTKSAVQVGFGGGTADAFVAKLDTAASSVTYFTFYGGSGLEFGLSIAPGGAGTACVSGETFSVNFPVSGAFQATFGDTAASPTTRDAFFLKLSAAGNSVSYASFLGGSSDDFCDQIAVTPQGEICLAGHTASPGFPVTNAWQPIYGGGAYDAWFAKVNSSGSSLAFCTFWGGSGNEYMRGLGLGAGGDITFGGITSSTNFPLVNAFQTSYQGGTAINNDGFVVRMSSTGSAIRYASYIGGPGADDVQGLALDGNGNAVVVGITDNSSFPVVTPQQPNFGGGQFDVYVLRVIVSPPAAPTGLAASNQGTGAVRLTWVDQSNDETGFQVERSTPPGPFSVLTTVGSATQSYDDFFVVPTTTYAYRVRAVNLDGSSAPTNVASVTTPDLIPPPQSPNNLQVAVVSTTETALTWTDRSQNENLFEVQRRIVPGTFLAAQSLPPDTDSWNDTGLGPDTSVVYRVRSVGVTSASGWTNEAAVLTPPSFGLQEVKASLTDSATAAKDKAKAKGIYSFLPASKDGAIDPVEQGVTIYVGGEENPAVVSIAPKDPGWKVVKSKATWKAPVGSSIKATVKFDLVKRTFGVSLSKITFPGPVANPVRLSVRVGNDAGSLRTDWVNKRPGVFSFKQP